MVKADVKRDYYADLELPSTADTEEVKKQFRLLGKVMCAPLIGTCTHKAQRSNITPIAIPATKSKLSQSSKPYKPPTKF
jgi:hypothetical protein